MNHLKMKNSESIDEWVQRVVEYCNNHPNKMTAYLLSSYHESIKNGSDQKELFIYIRKQWLETLDDIFDMPFIGNDKSIQVDSIDSWTDIMYPESFDFSKNCSICLQLKQKCQSKICQVKPPQFKFDL